MTQRGRRPAITPKGDARRAAILSAAARLFAERGYRGASIGSVAAEVNLTQPGVLHYFPSKEDLLLALLENRYHVDGALLSDLMAGKGLPLLTALQRIVDHNEGSREAVKLFTVLVAEGISPENPSHEFFVLRYQKIRRRFLKVLHEDQEAGLIRTDVDLTLLAPIMVAVMDGLQSQWLLDPAIEMSRSFELFRDLLTAALAVREPVPGRPAG